VKTFTALEESPQHSHTVNEGRSEYEWSRW